MSGKVNDGGAAFPRPASTDDHTAPCNVFQDQRGMSLRDWLAGQALAGLLASSAHPNSSGPAQFAEQAWAEMAYRHADAMLAAREAQS